MSGSFELGLVGPRRSHRVVVAMSGGVDSSVVAGLLVEAGYDVVGVTLRLYDDRGTAARPGSCCAGRDVADAQAVAERLGIPHYVLDFEDRFRRAVIDDFAESYARGRTPIPCVRCNERVKFGDLLDIAVDLGASALATGHYVSRRDGQDGPELHAAADSRKDQSYFLFATTAAQLAFLRFPLGDVDKATTRAHAERLGLPVADKPESQDICFVPDGDHAKLVTAMRPEAGVSGELVLADGAVVGHHVGIGSLTVGQRRGHSVARGERLYVTAIDPSTRRVTLGPRDAARVHGLVARDASWLAAPGDGEVVRVRTRHGPRSVAARFERLGRDSFRIAFSEPQPPIAPGQACVAYRDTRLLGGGWIEATT